ncbi:MULTISPECIES: hypothetical protein [unclassified Agromyces]|uniref:hypothetical protein n=1 Tax=unclassified Agromyces TaxID=2639701 RepID=UPI0030145B9F
MEETARRGRLRRRAVIAAAVVALAAGVGLGVAWAATGTAERPGERLDVDPVLDGDLPRR